MVRMVFEYNSEYNVDPLVEILDEALKEEGWEKTKNPDEYVTFDHDVALGSLLGLLMLLGDKTKNYLDAIDKWLIYGLEGCEDGAPLDGKEAYLNAGKPKLVK